MYVPGIFHGVRFVENELYADRREFFLLDVFHHAKPHECFLLNVFCWGFLYDCFSLGVFHHAKSHECFLLDVFC